MEGYRLKIMELTDGGQFECSSEDNEDMVHDIILKINCELNNDDHRCEIDVNDDSNASAKSNVTTSHYSATTTTATPPIRTRIDGVGHNSSNHSINNLRKRHTAPTTTTIENVTTISASTVPTAVASLSARYSSANPSTISRVFGVIDGIGGVLPSPNVDHSVVVVNRMVTRDISDAKSKRLWGNYARG